NDASRLDLVNSIVSFVWIASYGRRGRGTLRFLAVDASAISAQLVATQAPTNPTDKRPQATPSIAPLPSITADRAEQRKIAEAKASRNHANAPSDLQFLYQFPLIRTRAPIGAVQWT